MGEVKVGEWNQGKRVKWFDAKEIEALKEEGKLSESDFKLLQTSK